jgi:hypothetical protein
MITAGKDGMGLKEHFMTHELGSLLDEHIREKAREVLKEMLDQQIMDNKLNADSKNLREQLDLIKAKEYVTVREAALLLSCSESHIRKLVMLTRKGKARRAIPFVDMEGVTVFCLTALLGWANAAN